MPLFHIAVGIMCRAGWHSLYSIYTGWMTKELFSFPSTDKRICLLVGFQANSGAHWTSNLLSTGVLFSPGVKQLGC